MKGVPGIFGHTFHFIVYVYLLDSYLGSSYRAVVVDGLD